MLGNVPILKVASVKYLGHILSVNMTDDANISQQNKSLFAQGNSIIRKFHICTVDVKLKLFEAHCLSMYSLIVSMDAEPEPPEPTHFGQSRSHRNGLL